MCPSCQRSFWQSSEVEQEIIEAIQFTKKEREGRINWFDIFYRLSERFGWDPNIIKYLNIEQIAGYLKSMSKDDRMRLAAMKRGK